MKRFAHAHATHPQWRMAAALVLAQLRAQLALPEHAGTPGLALLYITDHYADDAADILDHLSAELPEVTDWAGTVGVGIAATNVEYFDEPAMAVMLCDLAPDQYRVFSGVAPLPAAIAPGANTSRASPGRRTGSSRSKPGLPRRMSRAPKARISMSVTRSIPRSTPCTPRSSWN